MNRNRKFFHAGLLATSLMFIVLSSCQRSEEADLSQLASSKQGVKTITLYSWDEYFSEDLFDEFEERYGIAIDYQKYLNTDEVFQNLRSKGGAYDVIVLDDASMKRAKAMRLLRPLEHDKIPNIKNIDPEFVEKAVYDPGLRYSVPYMWGTTLLAYRTDLVENIEHSWKVLFDPAYAGKISLLDERMECFATALRVLGHNMNSGIEKELEDAKTKLVELVRDQKARLGSDNEMKRHLKDGESLIAMMYSGDAALIAEDNPIGFFIPEEGATRWTDSFAISRDSQAVEEAHLFIDFMADAKVAAQSSNELWYATPNLAAYNDSALNEELRNDETIYPTSDVMNRCEFLVDGDKKRIRTLNSGWDTVQSFRTDDTSSPGDAADEIITSPVAESLEDDE